MGEWKHGLSIEIIWVLVKMDNGIIGDFKIGVEMMKGGEVGWDRNLKLGLWEELGRDWERKVI